MPYTAAVAGASGYTGAELLRLLAGHDAFEVGVVTAASNAGERIASMYPSLAPVYGDRCYDPLDPEALAGVDVLFCTMPHGESQKLVPAVADRVGHVIDLGADFRLPPDVYAQWYHEAHAAPDWCERFAFGMVELFRADLTPGTKLVAAAGCHATAVALACAPFVAAGLVEPSIVATSSTGVSGAGRALKTTSLFSEANDSISAYGLLSHRHTAEMEQALSHVGSGDVQVLFTPQLVPMTRGILATCYARPTGAPSTKQLLDVARDFYASDPFVFVVDDPSPTKATYGSNAVHITARYDERTGNVLAIAALDNLVKGASGQMVQAANLVLGLDETAGLTALGIQP